MKRRTSYSTVVDENQLIVHAKADSSASGLITRLDVDPLRFPTIEWRWRAQALIEDADNAVSAREDSPLRIVLAFDGDQNSLPIRERMFNERVKLLSGREMPFASLMYIWGNQHPPETLIGNPHTTRIQKLVVDSDPRNLKQWQKHRRNIVADYTRAFGTPPGRLIAVGIMTDTDNTGSKVVADYGDIRLLPAGLN